MLFVMYLDLQKYKKNMNNGVEETIKNANER